MSVKKEILRRVTVVYLVFLLIGLVIVARIFYLQVFEKKNGWIRPTPLH